MSATRHCRPDIAVLFTSPPTKKVSHPRHHHDGDNYDADLQFYVAPTTGLRRSRVPSGPAGRDPGRDGIRDGTGFFKGIFDKNRPVEIVQKTF